jgi:hypothetical protein
VRTAFAPIRKRALIPLVAILISPLASGQSPLDQPSEKKITVGSEIERGRREMEIASHASRTLNILESAVALDRVIDQNKSRNTDSDGFLLGAYLGKWMHLEILLSVGAKPQFSSVNSAEDIRLVKEDAIETFAKMRELQKKLGVNDDALFSAAGFQHAEKIKDWIAKFESGADLYSELSASIEDSIKSLQPPSDMLTITQSVSVQSPSGNVVLPAGTKIQLVARNGEKVQVRYAGGDYEIPISATDLK